MHIIHRFGHLVGGTLLVAGTSIGVGMLALPVATAAGGFIPSLVVYLVCWLFMLCTGLLVLEACIWMPYGSNLITLTHRLLGGWGRGLCWILYLFLFTSLMVAHVVGGGGALTTLADGLLPNWVSVLLYVAVFSPIVYLGTRWVDRTNLVLMVGVVITYLTFCGSSFPYIDKTLLTRMDWSKAWFALPIIFTAFGYQSLIPTLVNYMHRDIPKIRFALIFGTMLPFLIYIVWELLIVGIIPLEGPHGLAAALKAGQNAVQPLGEHLNNPLLLTIGHLFAFFVMTTSFMGIGIAFVDFLADGLKVEKKGWGKFGLCVLIFVPPTAISLGNPQIFFQALQYAGGIGVALLLGLLPVLMVWSGRYKQGFSAAHRQLPGGRLVLCILILFVMAELIIEWRALFS